MSATYGTFVLSAQGTPPDEYMDIWDHATGRGLEVPIAAWRDIVEAEAKYFKGRTSDETTWGPRKP